MATILSIETSTPVCSAAIAMDGQITDFRESFDEKSHATSLTVFINELLKTNQLKPNDLDAVAISQGPGSYTGLRIGVSVAKGICYALGIKLLAIDTLRAMALMAGEHIGSGFSGFYCPMIDARRMEVYTALFNSGFEKTRETQALVVDENQFKELLQANTIAFFGDGAAKCRPYLTSANAQMIENIYPSARFMAYLANEAFVKGDFKDVAYFEPFYLKDFVTTTPKIKVL
jgi:tRNA threonylcarbamoyladenosine biosynthesis protein TsaB